jgi:hypothetical protein
MIFVKWFLIMLLSAGFFAFAGAALFALADAEGRGGPIAGKFLGAALLIFVVAISAAIFWKV